MSKKLRIIVIVWDEKERKEVPGMSKSKHKRKA